MKRAAKKRAAKKRPSFEGADVVEFFRHLQDRTGEAHKSDWMLYAAKKADGKRSGLSDAELRAVAWFAFLPGCHVDDKPLILAELRDNKNQFSNLFFSAWLRMPDAVCRLLIEIRKIAARWQIEDDPNMRDMVAYPSKLPPKGRSDELESERRKSNSVRERVKTARRLTKPSPDIFKAVTALRNRGKRQPR